ncbi:hypothetical protein MBAV_003107 [Candidatus Magnetobacterium bavaricum]|uniref:Uncharacterized protein n=1 Tax=Candidatus Magnetobacterium bavaricum TaxID=29290 RepID=A0A0F3GRV5_9BACT|nr:hypothetical protein MBAV_003107 [Candidatus Magnetobacterium bavaricum]
MIEPFDYKSIEIVKSVIIADETDKTLMDVIRELDKIVERKTEYTEYEETLYTLASNCEDRFRKWLSDKGMDTENARGFASCISIYVRYIYGHKNDNLKNISIAYIDDFLTNHLLKTLIVENPNEYVYYPPSLKLFYWFLYEKEYFVELSRIMNIIGKVEPYFMKVLRKEFT